MTTNVSMIARALSALGLMKRAEHERIVDDLDMQAYSRWRDAQTELDKLDAKFKLAATDLEAEVIASESYGDQVVSLNAELARLHEIIDALRPDAQKWRNSLKRSRDRRAGKKGVAA